MKTKSLFLTLVLLALGGSLSAQVGQQGIASNPLGGDLTATSANCATVQSCVWMRLPSNGSTATVTLAGTFVQTDLIELSGDGGNTWITNATLSAVGITSVSVSGFSDIRVRCSAFTSGRASVTINVGILQVQSVVSSSSSSSSLPSAGQIDPTQAPYNAKFDAKVGNDGTTVNGQNTLASTNQVCVAADTGKLIIAINTGTGAYSFGTGLVTVTGCSGNNWTASGNAGASAGASQNWAIGSAGNGLALSTAYLAAITARKVLALPCGTGILDTVPFTQPAINDYITMSYDLIGCNGTSGTRFVFHPNISAALGGAGGPLFAVNAGNNGVSSTGFPTYNGIGGQIKASNLFITSLSGRIPGTGGQVYPVFQGFNALDNITIQALGLSAGTLIGGLSTGGESHFGHLNFQNWAPVGVGLGVQMQGQGTNTVFDSIFAFQGIAEAISCIGGGTFCASEDNYIISTSQGIRSDSGAGNVIKMSGTFCSVAGGSGSQGCLSDNGNATTFYVFGNQSINSAVASFPAITLSNASSVLDISGSIVSSNTSGFNASGIGTINDRAGNVWSSPLTQFTGKYVPIGGGSVATNSNSAATNFGANLGATNIVTTSIAASTYDIKIGFRQSLLGVGCGAGSNTVNGVLSWTSGGVVQSTGAGGVTALPTLTISANGAVGTSSAYSSVPVHADINTAITFTTTSVLASAGCGTVPQYVVDFSNI